jgi:3-hydroxyacyl-[acyl-carrier-protein] dehydratase
VVLSLSFADEPNVPGFIQIEMLTQMFLMTFLTFPENKGKKTSFVSVNNAKFKKKIVPGIKVEIKAELKTYRRGLVIGSSVGYVDGEVACSIELIVARRANSRISFAPTVSKDWIVSFLLAKQLLSH